MSVEKNQLFKVGDKVKILPAILSYYSAFPYVGCEVDNACVKCWNQPMEDDEK